MVRLRSHCSTVTYIYTLKLTSKEQCRESTSINASIRIHNRTRYTTTTKKKNERHVTIA